MAGDNDTKIALIEDRLMKMAEEMGLVKRKQDDIQTWIHEHEKKELNHHNEIMNAITGIGSTVDLIKVENEKQKQDLNSNSSKRKENFDRMLRIALAAVVLVGALNGLYTWIRSLP
jgi:hypothetical protein